jgi:Na+/H+ antiporter NhaD/arsenite permease-like protein
MKKKFLLLFLFSFLLGIAGHLIGLTLDQSFILTIFSLSILGILFFWELRISFLFIGGGLSFEDFLTHALPVSMVILLITMFVLCIWYRDYIKKISSKLLEHRKDKTFLNSPSIDFDAKVSMAIFAVTIALIALHKRLETLFGIEENDLLIILPIISAGVAMLYRRDKARYYIEHEIEWRSLLFFMFLIIKTCHNEKNCNPYRWW